MSSRYVAVQVEVYLNNRLTLDQVNPLFGLRPDYSLFTCIARNSGMEYHEVIAEILASAFQRQG